MPINSEFAFGFGAPQDSHLLLELEPDLPHDLHWPPLQLPLPPPLLFVCPLDDAED